MQLSDLATDGYAEDHVDLDAEELALLETVRGWDERSRYVSSDRPDPMVELTAADLHDPTPWDEMRTIEYGFLSLAEDWTLPYVDSGTLSERYRKWLKAEQYPFDTQSGIEWYGAMTAAGFGPASLKPFAAQLSDSCWDIADSFAVNVVTAEDPADVRQRDRVLADGRVEHRSAMLGYYVDYESAATMHESSDDDMWVDGVWDEDEWQAFLDIEGL